jgi:hypothetical protein
MILSLPMASAKAVGIDLPRLKCNLRQEHFYTEILFKKNTSHYEAKGYLGELRNYVMKNKSEKKFISGMAFKSVYYTTTGIISGIVGDEFGSTGSFTMTNFLDNPSGIWHYSYTDLSGAVTEASFNCSYGVFPKL